MMENTPDTSEAEVSPAGVSLLLDSGLDAKLLALEADEEEEEEDDDDSEVEDAEDEDHFEHMADEEEEKTQAPLKLGMSDGLSFSEEMDDTTLSTNPDSFSSYLMSTPRGELSSDSEMEEYVSRLIEEDSLDPKEARIRELETRVETLELKISIMQNSRSLENEEKAKAMRHEVRKREKSESELRHIVDRVSKTGLAGWCSTLVIDPKTGLTQELDKHGNPRFILALASFAKEQNRWYEMYCKFLFKNRVRLRSDMPFVHLDETGLCFKDNALHYCARFPKLTGMLEWFLRDSSIDPNGRSEDEWRSTPLIIAASVGNDRAAKLLIKTGRVDVNAADYSDETALMHAAGNNHESTVRLLLKYHSDLAMANNFGKTALDLAREMGHTRIVNILLSVEEAMKATLAALMGEEGTAED